MFDVIGVLLNDKNIHYFSPLSEKIKIGQKVIVNIDDHNELGLVKTDVLKKNKKDLDLPLNKIIRIATKKDLEAIKELEKEEKSILKICKKEASSLKLPMNFVEAKYSFDKTQLYISYTAESRIDFREDKLG